MKRLNISFPLTLENKRVGGGVYILNKPKRLLNNLYTSNRGVL